jgi:hypothetical protein
MPAFPLADYAIYVRDSSRNLIGEVDAYDSCVMNPRYNALGSWGMQVKSDHPMAPYLATPGNGIVVIRTVYARDNKTKLAGPSVFFSGPVRSIRRKGKDNLLIVGGACDKLGLACRDAYPVVSYPYQAMILAETGLLRFFPGQEPSGTVATDTKNAKNATYTNSPSLNQAVGAGVLDDPAVCVSYASASSQYAVSSDLTGFPTGDAPFSIEGWFYAASFPSATAFAAGFGKNVANAGPSVFTDTSGFWHAGWNGGNIQAAAAVTSGTWHHVIMAYRVASHVVTLYIDGVQSATGTGPTFALATASCEVTIGTYPITHTPFFNGKALWVAFYGAELSATQAATHYAVGKSRFAYASQDARTGNAETILRQYIDLNAISAIADPEGLSRVVAGLTLQTNNNLGATVSEAGRFDPLMNKNGDGLLQRIANAGGIGFDVLQDGSSSNLLVTISTPTDHTADVIFDFDKGTLNDFDYLWDAPDPDSGGNQMIVGGQGQGTARVFAYGHDATSISSWGRAEGYVDRRDTADATVMAGAASQALTNNKDNATYQAELSATGSVRFGVEFKLGDKVSTIVDGTVIADVVREVVITLDIQGQETVTPIVGGARATEIQAALGNYRARQLAAAASRASGLERRY